MTKKEAKLLRQKDRIFNGVEWATVRDDVYGSFEGLGLLIDTDSGGQLHLEWNAFLEWNIDPKIILDRTAVDRGGNSIMAAATDGEDVYGGVTRPTIAPPQPPKEFARALRYEQEELARKQSMVAGNPDVMRGVRPSTLREKIAAIKSRSDPEWNEKAFNILLETVMEMQERNP